MNGIPTPIRVLNFIVPAAGTIGLCFEKQWALLVEIFLVLIMSTYGVSFVLLPGTLIGAAGILAGSAGKILPTLILLFMNFLWTATVITIWCAASFEFVYKFYQGGISWPYLFAAYGMATGPWTYRASKENGVFSGSHVFASGACIGAATIVALCFLQDSTFKNTLIAAMVPMAFAFCFQFFVLIQTVRSPLFAEKMKSI